MFTRSLISVSVLGLVALAACSDNGSTLTGSKGMKAASLSFATRTSAAAAIMPDVIIADTLADTLVLQTAQLVLDHIEVAQASGASCDGTSDDGCNEMELGPVLVDLPLNGSLVTNVNVALPAGTYSKIEFKLRAPTGDDPAVVQFLQDHPDFAGISVKVTGTYNGTPFTFTSKVDAGTEIEFNPPVTIDSTSNNVTVSVDVSQWFRGGNLMLIDPATANEGQPNADAVASNIERSFNAFEDDNHDGRDDGGDNSGGDGDSTGTDGTRLNR